MKAFKYLVVIAALVLIGGVVADSWAQCLPGRLFRSSGKLGNNMLFDTTGADNNNNQLGRIWDYQNSLLSDSGVNTMNTGLCPMSDWWKVQTAPAQWKLDGVQGAGLCIGAGMGCPGAGSGLAVVVEDYAAGGPPGVGNTAYYAAYLVDETPAAGRWYDYGNLDGSAGGLIPMLPFPDVVITGSSRAGASISVNYQNLDQTNMVHSTDWAGGGGVFPTGTMISEWQLVKATATADPGRDRSLGWVTIASTPYVPGGAAASFVVPCSSTATDEYLAVGIGFNGGAGGVLDSQLVGKAIQLECDPNLAEPGDIELQKKPSATQLDSKPRSGGRR